MHVQAFVAQPLVEAFYMAVYHWLFRKRKIRFHATLSRPGCQGLGGEFVAVDPS